MKKIVISKKSRFIEGTLYKRGVNIKIERGLLKNRKWWKTYAIYFPSDTSKEVIKKYIKRCRSKLDLKKKA